MSMNKLMNKVISISALSTVSALGSEPKNIWDKYLKNTHYLSNHPINNIHKCAIVGALPKAEKQNIHALKAQHKAYKNLDDSVLMAILTAENALNMTNWNSEDNVGINIGSSRGATTLFEKHHQYFLNKGKASSLSSPTTTLGNISSWVAHHLNTNGPNISHSITCSTSLHAVLNAVAWIQAGLCEKFIVGGSEAPLTAFTLAQMQALKIYAKSSSTFPCRALDLDKTTNTMVLGEAAAVACLESGVSENTLAVISGIGYATEILNTNTGISNQAECLQKSMTMALKETDKSTVDVIITHTPGTLLGDQAEMNAIHSVFGRQTPAITTNKWKIGHTLASSGMLSIELAVFMIDKQKFIGVPYLNNQISPTNINTILVNSVGFGGNAVSLLLRTP